MSAPATRAELDAERAERAGGRELRYTRSGVLVGLYDNVPAGLDPEPGRWSTVCEVHAHIITHRTLADPRFLDPAIDPNDRPIGTCYLGHPETVNTGPVGIGRFSTLRAWLSQWSVDDTHAHGEKCAARIRVKPNPARGELRGRCGLLRGLG